MNRSKAKTSLNLTLNPDGSSKVSFKWSNIDMGHHIEASERILTALTNFPDYEWLFEIIQPVLYSKYCAKCNSQKQVACDDKDGLPPFPYCFSPKPQEDSKPLEQPKSEGKPQ